MLALSTLCFALLREPPAPVEERPLASRAFLREGLQVLRTDRRLRTFLIVQWLAGVSLMLAPLYVAQARRRGLAEVEVGTLIAAQMAGQLASNPLWGLWGDRRGKLSLLKGLALTGMGNGAAGGRSALDHGGVHGGLLLSGGGCRRSDYRRSELSDGDLA